MIEIQVSVGRKKYLESRYCCNIGQENAPVLLVSDFPRDDEKM